ncbi:hypothetical protein LCGC14_1807230, partial [marine sediment metagenome]
RKTLLLLGLVYFLSLQNHDPGTYTRKVDPRQFDTWYACEQARMEIERTTHWRGECFATDGRRRYEEK